MTEEEQAHFCATLCAAARRLSIPIVDYGNAFGFMDKQVGIEIRGFAQGSRKDCLVSACEELQKYLTRHVV